MNIEKMGRPWAAGILLSAMVAFTSGTGQLGAQSKAKTETAPRGPKKKSAASKKATARFAARADALLGTAPASKGEWGILLVEAESGETLYEQNADKFFVPASNMKLFSTALALAKLGPDFRSHTTLETRGAISSEGVLSGDVALVGRGDPNLSNRRFPYQLKEEFDGPPEKVLAELADALVAKGVKEISGDVVGDDSYFPRERYPNGWEIDDMVWEYGAAVSSIVVEDNTVALTLTPGEIAGSPVRAVVSPATPDFAVQNDVVTSAAEAKPDLTLRREPGASLVVVKGTLPAKGAPRKLVHKIESESLGALPGETLYYAGQDELQGNLEKLVRGAQSIAMQYSPRNAIPYVSMVDAGTVELVRSVGPKIFSSADLVQKYEACWTAEQLESHLAAGEVVDRIIREAFQVAAKSARDAADRVFRGVVAASSVMLTPAATSLSTIRRF